MNGPLPSLDSLVGREAGLRTVDGAEYAGVVISTASDPERGEWVELDPAALGKTDPKTWIRLDYVTAAQWGRCVLCGEGEAAS